MCKKFLQGLFGGGGGDAPAPSAKPEANYSTGKEGEVLGTVAGTSGGGSVDTTSPKLSGGLDVKKRGKGVPGLGL